MLGVAASVAANALHAQPNLISRLIAAWPPVALLMTIEIIARVPIRRLVLAAARLVATAAIAGIAAWISYWHMVGVVARYGEEGASPYLLPVCIDGTIVVASISLVELSNRTRQTPESPPWAQTPPPAAPDTGQPQANQPPDRVEPNAHTAAGDAPANAPPAGNPPPAQPRTDAAEILPPTSGSPSTPLPHAQTIDGPADQDQFGDRTSGRTQDQESGGAVPRSSRRNAIEKDVIDAYLRDPTTHPAAIALSVGASERTVRRYLQRFKTSGEANLSNAAAPADGRDDHPRGQGP